MTTERTIDWEHTKACLKRDGTSLYINDFILSSKDGYIPGAENADLRLKLLEGFGRSLSDFTEKDSLMSQMDINPFRRNFSLVTSTAKQITESTDTITAFEIGKQLGENRIADARKLYDLYDNKSEMLNGFVFLDNMGYFNRFTRWAVADFYGIVPDASKPD